MNGVLYVMLLGDVCGFIFENYRKLFWFFSFRVGGKLIGVFGGLFIYGELVEIV